MKLKTIKTTNEIMLALGQEQPIEREPVELVTRDGTVREVRIGGLHIAADYGLSVTAEQPYDEAKRYRVTATIEGFEPRVEYFEDYSKMLDFKRSFDSNVDVKVDENVPVLIDDDGNVVAVTGDGQADDLPF